MEMTKENLLKSGQMKQINWKWPSTRNNNLLPWYVILKNLPALPLILLGMVFFFTYIACMGIAYFLAKGWDYVKEWVKDQIHGFGVY